MSETTTENAGVAVDLNVDADLAANEAAETLAVEDAAPELSPEERELSELYGDDLKAPAVPHREYADRQTADEDRRTRHATGPNLSPDGSLLACVVVERSGYPRAVQRPLAAGGMGGAGGERDVELPVEGAVRKVAYSPDGSWLACEIAAKGLRIS